MREDGFWAVVIGEKDFRSQTSKRLRWPDGEFAIPGVGVRIMRDGRFLVAGWWQDSRHSLPENNCWIYDTRGDVHAEFFVGGPSDLLIGDDYIVTIYSDQAIFGNDPMGKEGIAAFDLNGERLWGYHTDFDDVDIYDCYAACIDDTGRLLAYPYGHPELSLDHTRRPRKVARDYPHA